MNISGILDQPSSRLRSLDCSKRTGTASFQSMLSAAQQAQPETIQLYLPRENTIYSGGTGYQTVYAEYTADSTADDPVVRVMGQASSGAFDFTCRINDIDPNRASYAEMCALWGHLQKSGEVSYDSSNKNRNVIPYGVETGDITRRQNYMSKISMMTTSTMFDQGNRDSARTLLNVYQSFIDAKQEGNKDSGIGMEMRTLDNGLVVVVSNRTEQLPDRTDPADSPTAQEAYDRLSAASKDVLDRMKAGQDGVTKDEWTGLCRELRDAGMISSYDFACASLDIVPVGQIDDNGNVVTYDNPPLLGELSGRSVGYSSLGKSWAVGDWSGDPLKYLDEWIESLRKWRNDLAAQVNADGTGKYGNMSPLDGHIESCLKVSDLMRELMQFV